MTVYGTKIKSDIDFLLDLSHETKVRYEAALSSRVPDELKEEDVKTRDTGGILLRRCKR
jgi:hypothetical protein